MTVAYSISSFAPSVWCISTRAVFIIQRPLLHSPLSCSLESHIFFHPDCPNTSVMASLKLSLYMLSRFCSCDISPVPSTLINSLPSRVNAWSWLLHSIPPHQPLMKWQLARHLCAFYKRAAVCNGWSVIHVCSNACQNAKRGQQKNHSGGSVSHAR